MKKLWVELKLLLYAPTSHLFKWVFVFHMLMHVALAQIQKQPSIKLKMVYIIPVPGQAFNCGRFEMKLAKILLSIITEDLTWLW